LLRGGEIGFVRERCRGWGGLRSRRFFGHLVK
jgi:hypothetical protein